MAYNLAQMEYFNGGQQYLADNGAWGNTWMNYIQPFMSGQPFFPVPGNHENMEANWANMNRFNIPSPGFNYYSVDIGNVHAIGINSNIFSNYSWSAPNTKNVPLQNAALQWLTNDLNNTNSNSTQRWKVVFLHQPFYCSGNATSSPNHCGPSSAGISAYLEAIFIQYGVDLVITGHVHNYERFFPMSNPNPNNTVNHYQPTPDISSMTNNGTANNNGSIFTNPKNPMYVACGAVGNGEGLGGANPDATKVSGSVTSFGLYEKTGKYYGPGSAICEFTTTSNALVFSATLTYSVGGGAYTSPVGTAIDSFTIVKSP